MTAGVKTKHTEQQVTRFLQDHLSGPVDNVIALSGGEWSQAFAFNRDGRDFVIRFGHYAEDYHKDNYATRFATAGLPLPKIFEVGEALGGYFAISERATG